MVRPFISKVTGVGCARVFTVSLAVLLAIMLGFIATTLPTAKAATRSSTIVKVLADRPWTNTGINVKNGDRVSIKASGTINVASGSAGANFTPDGRQSCIADNSFVAAGLHCWSLIGGIGGYPPQEVGSARTFRVSLPRGQTGRLYLGVNDQIAHFGDNSGYWTARIVVRRAVTGDAFTYPMNLADQRWFVGYDRHPVIAGKSQCYGVPYTDLWHAGEDWGASTAIPIHAVAAGVVRYSSKLKNGALEDPSTTKSYPGGVVIIEHTLPNGRNIWSMYGHLDPAKVTVSKGDRVTKGMKIADGLIQQTYQGNNNTHLHWEMRYFFNGSGINSTASNYTKSCSGIPGPGYTYPGRPDGFVANGGNGPTYRWTDPSAFVKTH
jgi:peptidase M23-like protein